MPVQSLIDNFSATVAAPAYVAGGASMVLNTVTGLPAGACDFFFQVLAEGANTTEIFHCSNVNTGTLTLTVAGAQANTVASNHAIGAVVKAGIITSQVMYPALVAPVQANWTAFNVAGMAQAPTFANARWEWATNAAAGDNIQGVAIGLPTVPYVQVFRIWPLIGWKGFNAAGVGWADGVVGTPGKLTLFGVAAGGAGAGALGVPLLLGNNYTNFTTFASTIALTNGFDGNQFIGAPYPIWFRLTDDNVNWKVDISYDGRFFVNVISIARNTFLTATQLVVIGNTGQSSLRSKVVFDHYN